MSPAILPLDFLPWGLLVAALAVYGLAVALLAAAGNRTGARALAGFVPDCVVLVRRLAADPATPRRERLMLGLLAAYLVSPLDLVPDFIPVVGQLDDAVLVALAVRRLAHVHGAAAVAAAWPGPEPSLRVVLSAAGVQRGQDGPPTTL